VSGLAVAVGVVLAVVFAWQMIDITGPAWAGRLVRAIRIGVERVPRSPRAALVALALIWLGALAIVVGVVLPLYPPQPPGSSTPIRHNFLAGHLTWALVGLAVIAAAAGYRGYRVSSRSWAVSALGLVAVGIVVWMASDSSLRSIYAFEVGCCFGPPSPTVLPLAAGPYVAGAGAILVATGGWVLRATGNATNGHSLLGTAQQIRHSLSL
jgi:hypothetical protein